MTVHEEAIEGRVLRPGDDGYDEARQPWQAKFDPHPALIVEAANVADVQAAVRLARERGLPLAVQATGHGMVVPSDGALLLKTGALNSVAVDAERRIARVGGGTLWNDVVAAAAPYGLAPLSGTSGTVGVAGYTLGGGAGWLSRKYGFAADSLLRAELVSAAGERLTASPDEHPDLFWALRGGGGNFGVVTALEFRLHPAERLYGGMMMFDLARARETLALYRDWALDEPDESGTAVVVMTVPPLPQMPEAVRGRRVLALRALYLGEAADGEQLLAPLLAAAGTPLAGALAPMTYPDTGAMGAPPMPMVADTSIELLREVPDAVLDIVADPESPVSGLEFRHWGGAMARPDGDGGPVGHRDVPFSVVVQSLAPGREQYPAVHAAVEEVSGRVRPYATGGSFLNFLGDPARTRDAYTEADWARLREVKATYDAANVFGRGHAIASS